MEQLQTRLDNLIFHITSRSDWHKAQILDLYQADSLTTEGFIHCSTLEQVVETANLFFAGRSNLVLLCIDPKLLNAEIRYEITDRETEFPHIYGTLNLDAVVSILDLEPNSDGKFKLPQILAQ